MVKKIILGSLFFSSIIISITALYFSNQKSTVAYIRLQEVYDNFTYKKKLQEKLESISNVHEHKLDSLKVMLNAKRNVLRIKQNDKLNEEANLLNERIHILEKKFYERSQAITDDFTEKILKQLNQYISDFGDMSDYDIIIGASGEGNIMYGRNKLDLTTDIIEYINGRYEGEGR